MGEIVSGEGQGLRWTARDWVVFAVVGCAECGEVWTHTMVRRDPVTADTVACILERFGWQREPRGTAVSWICPRHTHALSVPPDPDSPADEEWQDEEWYDDEWYDDGRYGG